MTREDVIRYWVESSEVDFRAMESRSKMGTMYGRCSSATWSLRSFSRRCVKKIDANAPRIHDLLRLGPEGEAGFSR